MAEETGPRLVEEPRGDKENLTNLRGALSERAHMMIDDAFRFSDDREFHRGFVAGIEHIRLVLDLLMTTRDEYSEEIVDALRAEEAEFRTELDQATNKS